MATSTSALPQKRNLYTLSTLSLLLLFLFCLILFSKRALEPNLSLYRDLISLTPVPLLHSPPRSTQFHEKIDDLRQPNTISSENVDGSTTISSRLSQSEFQEERNEETKVPISSDVDDKTTQKTAAPVISSELDSQDNLNETSDESMSSNAKMEVPISSKSDLDDKTTHETAAPVISLEPESQDTLKEITAEPMLSNEKTRIPISSKSDFDDKNRGKPESFGVKEKSSEEAVSSDGETEDVKSNAIAEKLRNCDIYKGTWVKDEDYPLYKPGSCPYVDDGFDCQSNGRPDSGYLKWRWKPDECDLPRFTLMHFIS